MRSSNRMGEVGPCNRESARCETSQRSASEARRGTGSGESYSRGPTLHRGRRRRDQSRVMKSLRGETCGRAEHSLRDRRARTGETVGDYLGYVGYAIPITHREGYTFLCAMGSDGACATLRDLLSCGACRHGRSSDSCGAGSGGSSNHGEGRTMAGGDDHRQGQRAVDRDE